MDRNHYMDSMIYHQMYGGTVTGRLTGKSVTNMILDDLARTKADKEMAIPRGLYTSDEGRWLKMPDEITPPTNTKADREYLKMTITEYNNFAEAIQQGCYLNEQGDACKVKNAKTKKLKNLRYKYRKSPFLQASMIWKAQIHVIQMELNKRMAASRGV